MRRTYLGARLCGGIVVGRVRVWRRYGKPSGWPAAEAGSVAQGGHASYGVSSAVEARSWSAPAGGRDVDPHIAWAGAVFAIESFLEALREKVRVELGEGLAEVFDIQQMVLKDPELERDVFSRLERGQGLASAVHDAASAMAMRYDAFDNDQMRERAADVRDVGARLVSAIDCGAGIPGWLDIGYESAAVIKADGISGLAGLIGPLCDQGVLVAQDLHTSDAALLRSDRLMGIVLEEGMPSSRAAALMRALDRPTVVKTAGVCQGLRDGERIIVDGETGAVILDPNEDEIKHYSSEILRGASGCRGFAAAAAKIVEEARRRAGK